MSAQASVGDLENTITVQKETASGFTVHLNVSITTAKAPEFSRRSDGKTFYLVNGTPYENKDAVTVGHYVLTVSWADGDLQKWNDSGAAASSVDFTLTAKTQAAVNPNTEDNDEPYAELLKTGSQSTEYSSTEANNKVAASHTFRVEITAGGESGGVLSFDTASNYTNCTPTNTPNQQVEGLFAMRPGSEIEEDEFIADGTGAQAKQMTYSVDLFDIA